MAVTDYESVPAVERASRSPGLVVMKFGGTSVGDTERLKRVARRRALRDLVCQPDQIVRRLPHGGHDGHHAVAGVARGDAARGDALQALGVADRRAAELHHHEAG